MLLFLLVSCIIICVLVKSYAESVALSQLSRFVVVAGNIDLVAEERSVAVNVEKI